MPWRDDRLGLGGDEAGDQQDRRADAGLSEPDRLVDPRHGDALGAGREGGSGDLDGAEAVRFGLDDGADPGVVADQASDRADVLADRVEVDVQPAGALLAGAADGLLAHRHTLDISPPRAGRPWPAEPGASIADGSTVDRASGRSIESR